jgi:hypothetical protein
VSARRGWQQFEVVLTGAFLTGQPLQVRVADYCRVQQTLGEGLKQRPGEGWEYEPLRWHDIAGSYDGGGGYPSLVPLVLLRRTGGELKTLVEQAQTARPDDERAWLDATMAGWTWRLRSITVEVFDFGVGVIEGRYEVAAPPLLGVHETRRAVAAVSRLKPDPAAGIRSPIAASYEAITLDTVRTFRDAVAKHAADARQEPWLTPLQTALRQTAEEAPPPNDWGRLLWLHPVYVLQARARAGSRQLHRLARPFQSSFTKTLDLSNGVFAPGIDSSVMVARGDAAPMRDDLMNLIVLNWAYYALFMEVDRGLLATLDNDKWQTSGSLGTLEEDAERMFAVYMRVQETQARLNSVLADLGGGALTLWDAIAEVQRFGELVSSVEGKVENLQRVAERRVQEATVDRARRAGNILGGLTALTVVTVVIGLFGSLVGSRSDTFGHIELRTLTIVAAFFIALALYLRQREIVRKRKRARRLNILRRRPQA